MDPFNGRVRVIGKHALATCILALKKSGYFIGHETAPVSGWGKVACEVKRADQRAMINAIRTGSITANPAKRRERVPK